MSGRLTRMLRLFVPGSIRSREDARWCLADSLPSGTYNQQFLRSRAEGDFIRHPDYLWSPTPYWTARAGVNGHLRELADRLGGLVYSDLLIVLNPEDHARSEASLLTSWKRAAQAELAECFERLVASQGFVKAFPDRPLQLEVVRDGDPMIGATLGLKPGEFATALMPNLYLRPAPMSAPLVEVFVADERGRFGSVGTLYSDQVAFTVGAHALDNGRIERLGDSALYTLHRFPDQPGLHHKVNGERADRVVIETGTAHGGDTVRLVDRGRDKVLLEVMLVAARELDAELPAADEIRGPRPAVGLPGFLPASHPPGTILPEAFDLGTVGAFSIIPEALPQRIHSLTERGFLFQRLHFKAEMRGYHVELDRSGAIAPTVAQPIARLEVVDDRVSVLGIARDLAVDGAPLVPGKRLPLRAATHQLSWRDGSVEYRPLRRPGDRRWPYLARIDAPQRTTPLPEGEVWTVGRDSAECDVPLPDRSVTSNIQWRDGQQSGPVEVQGGKADRARFRTDAICVATRAASIDLTESTPALENLSTRCPLHVIRGTEVLRLKRGSSVPLQDGDELLIGNLAFVLVGPGGERPREVEQLLPAGERHQEGPGTRGRRPRVGGTAGALVDRPRTVRAVLGIDPKADSQPPVQPPRVVPVRPTSRPLPQLAVVEIAEDAADDVALAGLPTHALPSLSLDPTVDEWFSGGDGPLSLDGAPTIIDEDPDWTSLLRAAGSVEEAPALSPVPPTREFTAEEAKAVRLVEEPPPIPRGLRVNVAIAPARRGRRFGAGGLPGFGPRPHRRPTPSMSGD
jgi:hypothetical protein